MKFTSTDTYIAADDLAVAVNAAVTLERPLLVKGEPGTGKTELDTKYPYVCHAEMNAILNKGEADVTDARMYVALFPCNDCAKMIIQSGIKEVIYLNDKYHDTHQTQASRKLFDMTGVVFRQHIPLCKSININLT